MNKYFSLITAGIVMAFGSAAHAAESSVTIFGVVDTGFFKNWNKQDGVKTTAHGLKSGGEAGSRWGLRGAEDLGNGYKASFLLDSGFSTTTGASGNNSRLFGRSAWLGLSGGFGEVRFGRQTIASSDYFAAAASPFGNSFSQAGIGSGGFRAANTPRFDSQIKYISPKLGPVTLAGSYSFNAKGDSGEHSENAQALSLVAQYKAHGLTLVGSFDRVRPSDSDPHALGRKPTAVQLGGNYDLGVAKVYLGWSRQEKGWIKSADGSATGSNYLGASGYFNGHVDAYIVGGKIEQGANSFLLAYQYVRPSDKTTFRKNVNVFNGGYTYSLSKRTNVYALLSLVEGDLYGFKDDAYSRQAGVGVRHNF